MVWEATPKTRKSVSSGIQTPGSRFKKTRLGLVFSHFSVFGYPDGTLSLVFDILRQNVHCIEFRCNISSTRMSVLSKYPNTAKWVEKTRRSRVFFNWLRGVWIPDETFFRVFGMASQTIHNTWRNSKQKFAKFYANKDPESKPPSR